MSSSPARRVVSGIQPTGGLHLGNLLGAILRWVRMQDEAECLYFLADLHSLSEYMDPAERRSSVREMAAALIASGIDPKRSIVFAQSAIPAHTELCWILNGTARMGWLNRMTQWKDKAGKNREGAWRFMSWLMEDEPNLMYTKTLGLLPARKSLFERPEFTKDPAYQGFLHSFPFSIVSPYLAYAGWGGKIDSEGVPLFQQALVGKLAAKEFLDKFTEVLTKNMS